MGSAEVHVLPINGCGGSANEWGQPGAAATVSPAPRAGSRATDGKVGPRGGVGPATTLLGDERPLVHLAALRVLANQGRRDSLPHLGRLLDSPDTPVRTESIRIRRALTGQHFSFTVYEPAEKRAVSVEQWKRLFICLR